MNLSEFKAWFEGYTEAMDSRPTEKQWKRIQGRVKEIKDGPATSYPVYVDRYWPQRIYGPYYGAPYLGQGIGMGYSCALSQAQNLAVQANNQAIGQTVNAQTIDWNSGDAFRDLGRADALNGDAS